MPRSKKFSKCNLAYYIKEHNLTLQDLADEFEVSYQQIQKYKSGANEMPLMILIGMCKKFSCNPQDLYPEMETYYSGISIPKSSNEELSDEEIIQEVKEVHHHHYHKDENKNTLIDRFFHNVNLLDVNQMGAFLIKSGLLFLAFFSIGFYIWRNLGFHTKDVITQIRVMQQMYVLVIGIIAPIVLRHPLMYVLTWGAMGNIILDIDFFAHIIPYGHTALAPYQWWLVMGPAALLTWLYSLFVNRYFRKNK